MLKYFLVITLIATNPLQAMHRILFQRTSTKALNNFYRTARISHHIPQPYDDTHKKRSYNQQDSYNQSHHHSSSHTLPPHQSINVQNGFLCAGIVGMVSSLMQSSQEKEEESKIRNILYEIIFILTSIDNPSYKLDTETLLYLAKHNTLDEHIDVDAITKELRKVSHDEALFLLNHLKDFCLSRIMPITNETSFEYLLPNDDILARLIQTSESSRNLLLMALLAITIICKKPDVPLMPDDFFTSSYIRDFCWKQKLKFVCFALAKDRLLCEQALLNSPYEEDLDILKVVTDRTYAT